MANIPPSWPSNRPPDWTPPRIILAIVICSLWGAVWWWGMIDIIRRIWTAIH